MVRFSRKIASICLSLIVFTSVVCVNANELYDTSDTQPTGEALVSLSDTDYPHTFGYVPYSGPAPKNPALSDMGTQDVLPDEFLWSYDSSDENYGLTSAKVQGYANLCWDYSMLASAESSILRKYNKAVDLSEKQVAFSRFADANDKKGNLTKEGYRSLKITSGQKGGWTQLGSNHISAAIGASAGQGFILEDNTEDTSFQNLTDQNKLITEENDVPDSLLMKSDYYLTDMPWIYVGDGNTSDLESLKRMIKNEGPAVLSFCVGTENTDFVKKQGSDSKDHFYFYNQNITEGNHAVLAVGWDDDFDRNNFQQTPSADGALIVKNSWGTEYDYISYEDCSLKDKSSIATVYQK